MGECFGRSGLRLQKEPCWILRKPVRELQYATVSLEVFPECMGPSHLEGSQYRMHATLHERLCSAAAERQSVSSLCGQVW